MEQNIQLQEIVEEHEATIKQLQQRLDELEGTIAMMVMVETQYAHLSLKGGVSQNIVSWEDIEQVFPGVKRVRDGTSAIKFLRGPNQQSNNCCSHSVLGVVLSSSVELVGIVPSKLDPIDRQTYLTGALADAAIEDIMRFISLLAPEVQETVQASSDIYQAFGKAIKSGDGEFSRAELGQEMNFQELKTTMAKNMALNEAMNAKQPQEQALDNDKKMRWLQEQALDNDKEMRRLQENALERLAVLQSRVQAVLTQTL
ncbi:MAG: hypothetical protein J3R72DRAFT_502493 [Linnemannia gamsii]|nr:MAG: hypothetical protein J3R72DRAFT_502493 [Linnemannia gamsii]